MWLVFQGIVTRRSNFRSFGEEGTPYYTPRMISDEDIDKLVNKSAPKHEPPPNPPENNDRREKNEKRNVSKWNKSSRHVNSMDALDSLSPSIPISHYSRQVPKVASSVHKELGMKKYETVRMRIITEPGMRDVKMDVPC